MRLVIDLPDMYVETLGKWASVSRTLTTANQSCLDAASLTEDERLAEQYTWCSKELNTITRPLDVLHDAARQQIWAIQRGEIDPTLSAEKQFIVKEIEYLEGLLQLGDKNEVERLLAAHVQVLKREVR